MRQSEGKANSPKASAASAPLPVSRYLVYFSIALIGCLLDLWTKHAVIQWRGIERGDHQWWIIEDYVGIEVAMNPGALFGIGAGGSMFFAGLSMVAAVAIVIWLFYAKAAHDWWLTLALACVTAGILGNLYDRLGWGFTDEMRQQYITAGFRPEFIATRENAVRDWILFQWPAEPRPHKWPNFNIADMLLVGGAGTLVWRSFQKPAEEE